MLVELRTKSQVTIPKELVEKLGLSEGDKFDVFEESGIICFMPIAVYSKQYLAELKETVKEIKNRIALGEQSVFDNVDALFEKLESTN